MQFAVIQRVMGLLLVFFSTSFLPAAALSLIYHDGALRAFLFAYLITLGTGVALWLPVHHKRREIRLRDGFVIVTLFWTILALFSALPFAIAEHPHMSITDAFFESMSGFTTTGATVLSGLDELPQSIRYYRQQLQWLGGMGIVVLAVAVMPMLGVGGMQLYRAETPGPIKENKLTPRIAETAKALWYIYVGLTVLCALAYWLAGMDWFDAIGHSFATIATGGFSTHDRSLGYFQSTTIDAVAIVFMFLAGINYAVHFHVWKSGRIGPLLRDPEVRAYVFILAATSLLSIAVLMYVHTFTALDKTVLHAVFHTVSFATTTGFTTADYSAWPIVVPVLLITASFVGGCAGSTAGGIKVIRMLLLYKQGKREIFRLVHPDAVMPIKVGGRPMDDRVVNAVWGFFSLYVFCFGTLSLFMATTGLDVVTAFSAVATCINNLGPGLGSVTSDFAGISVTGKWVLAFAMLLGRLEVFTVLVLFTPMFWRS